MKKLFFVILVALLCLGASNSYSFDIKTILLSPKRSNSFKKVRHTYEKQMKQFFKEVFILDKTGIEMDTTMRATLEDQIYKQFIRDYQKWAKWTKKHEGKRKFELRLKHKRKFEKEAEEYLKQFKLIQERFVKERLIWDEKVLPESMDQEQLQPYIDAVVKKFEETTIKKFQNLKPT